jgi:hypothetical protein
MTSQLPDELELLRSANPVSLEEVPDAPHGLYRRIVVAHPHRRRLPTRILIAAAAACAIALAATLVPDRFADERQGGVLELALAAVSEGPVIHALVENTESSAVLVDLSSGEETVERERHEYWYDEQRGRIHGRLTIGDEVLNEFQVVEQGPPPAHRALAFATHYREALESGKARVIRRETIDGRKTVLLRIDVGSWTDPRSGQVVQPAYVEEVVVDADSFKPLRFRHLPGPNTVSGPIHWWRVITIESIDRDDEDFTAGPPPRPWSKFAPSMDRKVTVDEAATALGRTALWPGTEIDGVPLQRIGVVTTTITWRDGRETQTPSLMIRYETQGEDRRSLWMSVGIPGQTPGAGLIDGVAVPAGKVRLMEGDRGTWFGNVQRHGVYVNLQSQERELIVAAAKALKPLG